MQESKFFGFFPFPPPVDPPGISALFFQVIDRPLIRYISRHQPGRNSQLFRHPADAPVPFIQIRNLPASFSRPQAAGDQDFPDLGCAQADSMDVLQFPPERFQ